MQKYYIYTIRNIAGALSQKTLLLFFLLPTILFAQLPQERVYIDTDKAFYLTGETAWFSLYCLEKESHKLSQVSKVAYLELIDKEAKPVMQEKIRIEGGKGKGQLFIKPELPSGVYYLRAYTSWMKNFDHRHFFESSIHIVNPFSPVEISDNKSDAPDNIPEFEIKPEGNILSLDLNKTSFGNREKVDLTLDLKKETLAHLSVSVYKHEPGFPLKTNMDHYWAGEYQGEEKEIKIVNYPPEIRTQVLTGRVNRPGIEQVDVFVPGATPQYYSIPVKPNQTFITEVSPEQSGTEILVWTENIKIAPSDIDVFSPFVNQHTIKNPVDLGFDEDDIPILETLSMNAQIANAYLPFSQTRGYDYQTEYVKVPFYGEADNTYRLDDYTRFPTLEEVFIEYVQYVKTRKTGSREHFYAWDLYTNTTTISNSTYFQEPALVIIDGVPVSDLSYVWNLDARLVEKIDIVNRKYLSGNKAISGILSFSTFKNDFGGRDYPSDILTKNFQGLMAPKAFYSPQYETEETNKSKIPDYRTLLHWEPDLTISDSRVVTFYTGDNFGYYRIEINGITSDGEKIHQTHLFQVTNYR